MHYLRHLYLATENRLVRAYTFWFLPIYISSIVAAQRILAYQRLRRCTACRWVYK